MSDDSTTLVAELVARCIEIAEGDLSRVDFDDVCAAHPELQSDVIEGVRVALTLPGLHAEGDVDRLAATILADRYQLGERLGAGAMGVVYRATDLDLGRPLAIKVMQTSLLERETALARFEREAAALAAVQHPAVVTIYDRGVTPEGTSFLAMELVEGVPCSRILELARERHATEDGVGWLAEELGIKQVEETSFLRQVMRWAADVASGLAMAHASGVVHRDVKPSNIIVRPNGKAVLLDFGIAAKDDQETLTQTGAAVGTPAYMAPEALGGSKEIQPSQDVWGLAATLYHMLTLEAPYKGGAHEVLAAIAVREPVPAAKLRPGIPRDAQAILDHGLARDPRSRYSSLAAMESDLRALLEYRPVGVRPTSTLTRLWRRARRSKVAIGAAAATLLIVAGLVGKGLYGDHLGKLDGRFDAAWAQVPANYGIVLTQNRVLPLGQRRDRVGRTLDLLVETGRRSVIARSLRAAYRWDHGDGSGAVADIEAIDRRVHSALSAAILERYRAGATGAAASQPISVDALPDPTGAEDHYLLAYQACRANDWGTALPLLYGEQLAGHRHAAEIAFVIDSGALKNLPFGERQELAAELLDRAESLFQERPFGSATVSHVAGTVCLLVDLFEPCVEHAETALKSAPESFVAMQNAALAAHHLGDHAASLAYCDAALEIARDYVPVLETKILALAGLQETDLARALLEEHRVRFSDERALLSSLRIDHAEFYRLMPPDELYDDVDLESAEEETQSAEKAQALEVAGRALEKLTQAPEWTFVPAERARFEALASGDIEGDFVVTLGQLLDDPLSSRFVNHCVATWPNRLSPKSAVALRSYLEALLGAIVLQDSLPSALAGLERR